jgi:hypothetical protein
MFGSARSINPEAGDHAVSTEPLEQAAAEAAVRASWREFPYYAKRYGERGWRFSLSDTGWIQTLCHLNIGEASAQAAWLGRLLATRGMPTYLLERHLLLLHRELLKAAPDRESKYARLLSCAASIRETWQAQIPESRFQELSQQFEIRVRGRMAHVANMGVIVVAAAADERAGIKGALATLNTWTCDASRFDAQWIAAVLETSAAAMATV